MKSKSTLLTAWMENTTFLSIMIILIASATSTLAQTTSIPGAAYVKMRPNNPYPSMVRMAPDSEVSDNDFMPWLASAIGLQEGHNFILTDVEHDEAGFKHYRMVQTYLDIPIDIAVYIVHAREGFLTAFGGRSVEISDVSPRPTMTSDYALTRALDYVGAEKYAWEDPELEQELREDEDNPQATYFPDGELVWRMHDGTPYLTFKFDIFSIAPHYEQRIYVDANSGDVLTTRALESSCDLAVVQTVYNGVVSINTQEYHNNEWRLKDDCQGAKIRIRDWNSGTLNSNPQEIDNNDNIWTTNNERFGGSVLWTTKNAYQYFLNVHGRDSYDNNGGNVNGYINAVFGCGNNCTTANNASMSFKSGSLKVGLSNSGDLSNCFATQDILAHEYAHAVTGHTAELEYEGESGGLNESFSDIFAEVIEKWQFGSNDWLLGAERDSGAIRDMSNPNAFSQPDTYLAPEWVTVGNSCDASNDQCGVHTNSGVQNFWFYLICEGGSGTNDNGDDYEVDGIGMNKGRRIAYRTLASYLGPNSDYTDARESSIQATLDLYGHCSDEVRAVTDAWYAVGIGDPFVFVEAAVISDYNGSQISCHGACDGMIWALGGGSNAAELDTVLVNLCAGEYNIPLIDENFCVSFAMVEITEPDALIAIASINAEPGEEFGISCAGESDGEVKVEVMGGTSPYTFLWSTGDETVIVSGLPAGAYTVVVTDVNGCEAEGLVTIYEPEPLEAVVLVTSNYNGYGVSCYDESDGSAEVHISGGIQPYQIEWTDPNNTTTPQVTGLSANQIYRARITDDHLCTTYADISLTEPDELTIEALGSKTVYLGFPDSSCAFLSSQILGGAPPYSVEWSTGEITDDINVCPDTTTIYTVTVTDANGCEASDEVKVCVIDVRCGKKLDKIALCHIKQGPQGPINVSLCLTPQAAGNHLDHGDLLGSCEAANRSCSLGNNAKLSIHRAIQKNSFLLEAFPNPFHDNFIIRHLPEEDCHLTISMYDFTGKVIDNIFAGNVNHGILYQFEHQANDLPDGIYYIRLESSTGTTAIKKLIHNRP